MERSQMDDFFGAYDRLNREATFDVFRAYLMQVVTIHHAMFKRLLFDQDTLPLELIELFEDAGKTYARISVDLKKIHGQSDSMLNSILKPES